MFLLCICPLSIKTESHSIQQLHMHRQTDSNAATQSCQGCLWETVPPTHTSFLSSRKAKIVKDQFAGAFYLFSSNKINFYVFNHLDNLEDVNSPYREPLWCQSAYRWDGSEGWDTWLHVNSELPRNIPKSGTWSSAVLSCYKNPHCASGLDQPAPS